MLSSPDVTSNRETERDQVTPPAPLPAVTVLMAVDGGRPLIQEKDHRQAQDLRQPVPCTELSSQPLAKVFTEAAG